MHHPENDLLISAYLDGELSPEETARAEQLLASNPEARQLYDELKALRAGLQELPQHCLEIDFAQRVLQQGQQQLDEQKETLQTATGPAPHTNQPTVPAIPSAHFPKLSRRGLGWSLVAIAAALMIMAVTNSQDKNRELGQQVARRDIAENRPLESLSHVASDQESKEKSSSLSSAVQKEDLGRVTLGAPLTTELRNGFSATLDQTAKSLPTPPPAADSAPGANWKQQAATKKTAESEGVAASAVNQSEISAGKPDVNGSVPVMVVHLDIQADADRSGEFDRLLAKNQIAMIDGRPALKDEALRLYDERLEKPSSETRATNEPQNASDSGGQIAATGSIANDVARDKADNKAAASSSTTEEKGQSLNFDRATVADELSKDSKLKSPGSGQDKLDVVYVEAAPNQIQALLADLQNAPQTYSGVAVTNDHGRDANRKSDEFFFGNDASQFSRDGTDQTKINVAVPSGQKQSPAAGLSRERMQTGRAQRLLRLNVDSGQTASTPQPAVADSIDAKKEQSAGGRGITAGGGFGGRGGGESDAFNRDSDSAGRRSPAVEPAQNGTLSSAMPAGKSPVSSSSHLDIPLPTLTSPATPSAPAAAPMATIAGQLEKQAELPAPERVLFVLRIVNGGSSADSASTPAAEPPASGKGNSQRADK
jgi:negative regulator of sigma E activity